MFQATWHTLLGVGMMAGNANCCYDEDQEEHSHQHLDISSPTNCMYWNHFVLFGNDAERPDEHDLLGPAYNIEICEQSLTEKLGNKALSCPEKPAPANDCTIDVNFDFNLEWKSIGDDQQNGDVGEKCTWYGILEICGIDALKINNLLRSAFLEAYEVHVQDSGCATQRWTVMTGKDKLQSFMDAMERGALLLVTDSDKLPAAHKGFKYLQHQTRMFVGNKKIDTGLFGHLKQIFASLFGVKFYSYNDLACVKTLEVDRHIFTRQRTHVSNKKKKKKGMPKGSAEK